ncbi:MAG: phenylalanine--tRNA ligase subunit beta [Candidatus Omnitrophota bacterium]|nr:phenylalanine--tRNA ligase subunit beta [Candidatus Omnitrophota bacterium]
MKTTYNWLKDFVEIKLSPQALAEKLTMAGLEVKAIEPKDGDFVFEVEITSNRPDWLNVIGIAREVAAITGKKLQAASPKPQAKKSLRPEACGLKLFSVQIENRKDCPLYTATIIEGVKVTPSPEWMQKRLRAVGLRPINNVVDITNYILYETGQPLHAFDLDKLTSCKPEIIIRRAKKGEEIVTIDGLKKVLNENILVIADANKPIAVAGITGGKNTEVSEETKNILLESAQFDPLVVRRGVRALGISSDSSYRFERKVDTEGVGIATQRAVELITELCGGEIISCQTQGIKKPRLKKKKIKLSIEKCERILGIALSAAKIKQILSALGFKLAACSLQLAAVYVPSFRQDVSIEEDLIEEVARVYGYDKTPSTLPYIQPRIIEALKLKHLAGHSVDARLTREIKNILTASGFSEVINYSLASRDALRKNRAEGLIQPVEIENPLSKDQEILRPDLFSSLLASTAYNLNRKNSRIRIFELGRVFGAKNNSCPSESLALGLAMHGKLDLDWQSPGRREAGFFDLKGCLEQMFSKLGIDGYRFIAEESPLFKQGVSFAIMLDAEKIGLIGEVDAAILENYDIKQKNIFIAQVSLQGVARRFSAIKAFKPYSQYPSIRRDISLVIKKDTPFSDVREIALASAGGAVSEVSLLEEYCGKQVAEGVKNLLISLEYISSERTLKDEEVDVLHKQILDNLVERLGIKIR